MTQRILIHPILHNRRQKKHGSKTKKINPYDCWSYTFRVSASKLNFYTAAPLDESKDDIYQQRK
jgi:hypothetical protein